MKLYQCHKRVRAAKIVGFSRVGSLMSLLLDDGQEIPVILDQSPQFERAEVGGYLVKYEDGYLSYSPAAAFESGYTEVVPHDRQPSTAAETLPDYPAPAAHPQLAPSHSE